MKVSNLSIQEIRRQFLHQQQPVTAQFLNKLGRDPRQGVRKLREILKKRYEQERAERLRLQNMLNFERVLWRSGVRAVAGVDEVGVGPLAGPVVAAAVIFPPETEIAGINDSKQLEPEQRSQLAATIRASASAIGVGSAEVGEIDRLNIYHAALLAMRRAIEALPLTPEHVLVDARIVPGVSIPQNCLTRATVLISPSLRRRLSPKLIETGSWRNSKKNIPATDSPSTKVTARRNTSRLSVSLGPLLSIDYLFNSSENYAANFQSCFIVSSSNFKR